MLRLSVFFFLPAAPAVAASGPFVSLGNTDFVVLIAFLLFIGILVYLKVPGLLGGLLDKRSEAIRDELEAARALREEAQAVLAGYERQQREVAKQAEGIVEHAKEEARVAAEQAKAELEASIARRISAAEERIASARIKAEREVRDQAVQVAVAAARSVISQQMTESQGSQLVDQAISTVESRLR